ncbi:MAG: cytochrome c oxidase accessory protein CcoG [Oligoflexia bacterium]|nr:cytochrome c oxidase accessory protein CcoG [Oligoflexia bacterium]
MADRELPIARLATTDDDGHRIWLYPADVKGFFRRRRTALQAILILVFLALPWLRIGGHQALLLDVPNRRFAIFGITFWAHDAPMLIFVAGGAAMTLAFVTAIWGRAWCGWACPQTVFIDSVFRRIENWIEGDAVTRRRLDEAPWSLPKFARKALKWSLFGSISLVLSHSFLAYFVGTAALEKMVASAPSDNPGSFLFMALFTGAVLFDFGWFREQFCTIVCPYGRFQSVLMDDQSVAVVYDARRGEPRRGTSAGGPQGDCVNCYRCVQVCPTGIDIRRGVQLECIACTACIDACDEVMRRLKKPEGLIRYGTAAALANPGSEKPKSLRRWIYLALLSACLGGLALTVHGRTTLALQLIRAPEAPYQELPGDTHEILNHYKMELRNQSFDSQTVEIRVPPAEAGRGVTIVVSNLAPSLGGGESERADLFIRVPRKLLTQGKGSIHLEFVARDEQSHSQAAESVTVKEVRLVGPYL